ncbi:hypothetical protein R1sor_014940 [Riccia sorocarpa]|uniref:Uncharacterized protein n=1 Tax=Riccia sorocarpa TaxID=122646 RepID=A0ABD3HF24_9MARC
MCIFECLISGYHGEKIDARRKPKLLRKVVEPQVHEEEAKAEKEKIDARRKPKLLRKVVEPQVHEEPKTPSKKDKFFLVLSDSDEEYEDEDVGEEVEGDEEYEDEDDNIDVGEEVEGDGEHETDDDDNGGDVVARDADDLSVPKFNNIFHE